jgi:excisionase family DNA binding protein
MNAHDVIGRTAEEVGELLEPVKRDRLIKLLVDLVALDLYFSPQQVAKSRGVSRAIVMRAIRKGKLRAHLIAHNRWRIPLGALQEWDEHTRWAGVFSRK